MTIYTGCIPLLKKGLISFIIFMAFIFTPLANMNVQAEDGATVADTLNKSQEKNTENEVQKDEKQDATPVVDNPFSIWDFIKLILALAFIVALIYFLLKFINQKTKPFTSFKAMENIGGVGLGANRSVQLIKVGEKVLVVGVGESVTLLKEIDSKSEIEAMLRGQEPAFQGAIQPLEFVSKWFQKNDRESSSNKQQSRFGAIWEQQLKEVVEGRKKIVAEITRKDQDDE